ASARRGAGVPAEEVDGLLLDQLGRWPDGDMVDDATWALVWPRIQSGAWEEAVFMADQVLHRVPRARSYRAEGRVLYWKGRALQHLERQDEAVASFKEVMRRYPLSWYCVLSHGRLTQISPEIAQTALSEAVASSQPLPDPLVKIPPVLWEDAHFRRGVAMLRTGLIRSAGRELKAARAGGGDEDKRVLSWIRAALFHRAGVYDRSVSLARAEEPSFGAAWPVGYHRRLWEIAHPRGFGDLVDQWAGTRGIDANWILSIIREESGFNPRVESWANAIGLMQIILPTAKSLVRGTSHKATPATLRRPEVAIELGSKYLAKLLGEHKVIPLASSGYNAGSGAMRRWRREFGDVELDRFVEQIPYREARGYAKRVTRSLARYTWLYGGEQMLSLDLSPPGPPESKK
ncbi:MAG: lytic transglycosylase domain-containing protein, partial [Myxococcota bacterium]|nr:lytic transglycosylase domain-containing protein [Myxococcota bacterium]